MAKAAVQHFGGTACPVTSRLSEVRADRAESACHELLTGSISLRLHLAQHVVD